MLSTFKTNMMNSGVMVESSDKFKQLIDKIKGLTEGEGNKGIQMTSGVINVKTSFPMGSYKSLDKSTNKSLRKLTIDCGFIPNLVIATTNLGGTMDFSAYIGGLGNENSFYSGSGGRNISGSGSLYPLSSEGFVNNSIVDLPVSLYGDYTYYAIGVGEEDTTLRDSLADILENKGVDVTEEDDMASLIGKVDSIQTSGGLDIISATKLPATGKENQICVVTDNPVNKFLVSSLDSDFSNLPNDTILLQTRYESTTHNYTINNGNIVSKYYISSCAQEDSIIPSYVYTSGQWVELTPGRLYFVKNKQIITTTEFGDIHRVRPPYVNVTSDGISFYSLNTTDGTCATITNKTNLSAFRNIHIVARVSSGGSSSKSIGVYSSSSAHNKSLGSSAYPSGYVHISSQKFTSTDYADGNVSFYRQEFDFDITDWTGEYYLGFYFYCSDSNERWMYIEEIYFY